MFFTFVQNNSGGSFDINDEVTTYVIVEADSGAEANKIAETKGIYFDGCELDMDCDCCGDRWAAQYDDTDGDETPMIYGKEPSEYDTSWATSRAGNRPYCYVYYKNGTKLSLTKGAD